MALKAEDVLAIVNKKIKNPVTQEQVSAAVSEYLKENPVTAGTATYNPETRGISIE